MNWEIYNMTKNSINQVTKNLDPKLRVMMRRLWDAAGTLDLDYPDLASYVQVCCQVLEGQKDTIDRQAIKLFHIGNMCNPEFKMPPSTVLTPDSESLFAVMRPPVQTD
jgi:hypothetical protein